MLLAAWVCGRMPYPPNLCASVPICGRYFSARRFRVFRGFCGNIVSHGFHGSTQMVCCVNPPTEFTEFTEVLLRRSSHGIHGIHRSFVALVLPQNSRNSQKFYCVAFFYKLRECSVGGTSLPEGSVCSVRSVGDIPACFVGAVLALAVGNVELRLLDSEGSVGTAGCHTLLICAHPCQSVGGASLPEGSVCSVRSVGFIPACFVGAVLALTVGKVELRLLDS